MDDETPLSNMSDRTERQLRNIIRDLGGWLAIEAMAELKRRGLPLEA